MPRGICPARRRAPVHWGREEGAPAGGLPALLPGGRAPLTPMKPRPCSHVPEGWGGGRGGGGSSAWGRPGPRAVPVALGPPPGLGGCIQASTLPPAQLRAELALAGTCWFYEAFLNFSTKHPLTRSDSWMTDVTRSDSWMTDETRKCWRDLGRPGPRPPAGHCRDLLRRRMLATHPLSRLCFPFFSENVVTGMSIRPFGFKINTILALKNAHVSIENHSSYQELGRPWLVWFSR